jgi:hypothetical protein
MYVVNKPQCLGCWTLTKKDVGSKPARTSEKLTCDGTNSNFSVIFAKNLPWSTGMVPRAGNGGGHHSKCLDGCDEFLALYS